MRVGRNKRRQIALATVVTLAAGIFCLSAIQPLQPLPPIEPDRGSAQLVSISDLPNYGDACQLWEGESTEADRIAGADTQSPFESLRQASVYAASQASGQTGDVTRPPVRNLLDTHPIYSSVAIDNLHDEVVLMDSNTWSIRVFNRLDNTPPNAERTEPKRVISGPKTDIGFHSGVYIDPKTGDISSVENDIGDSVSVFAHGASGDVAPLRQLKVTHRAYNAAVDEAKEELYVTVQYPPQVEVYRKGAAGDEKPLRVLSGESTRLSDAHGIAIDVQNRLMFVNNWGNISDYRSPGTGRFESASITVYPLEANGDTPPIRVIQGPRTQLNWPGAMSLDPESGDLYVANDMGHSILIFGKTAQGNAEPTRIIKGSRTGISYPTGVFVDMKNREVWVTNLGNSSATVYPLTANGNVAPLRTIRSAPAGKVSLRFGKTQALAYDSRREVILVPN